MGPKGCPKISVRNYDCSLCNNPEERISRLLYTGSLKLCIFSKQFISHKLWLPRSPDLNPGIYYLRRTLKYGVHMKSPHSLQELKITI